MQSLQQLDMFAGDPSAASYGWLGTVTDFSNRAAATWLNQMTAQYQRLYRQRPTRTQLQASGWCAYLTRDLAVAKQYCRDRYQSQPNKRYGIVASSRARNLTSYGVANDYKATQRVNMGPWYIDPPESPLSCCNFDQVVTEFGCQGLELDLAIVAWGGDLIWQADRWVCQTHQRNVQDPQRLRLNSYRVLLSRGRDGFIVFVPPEPQMDETANSLLAAGLVAIAVDD